MDPFVSMPSGYHPTCNSINYTASRPVLKRCVQPRWPEMSPDEPT